MRRFIFRFGGIRNIYYALSGNVFEEAREGAETNTQKRKVGMAFHELRRALFTLKSRNCNKFVCLTQ